MTSDPQEVTVVAEAIQPEILDRFGSACGWLDEEVSTDANLIARAAIAVLDQHRAAQVSADVVQLVDELGDARVALVQMNYVGADKDIEEARDDLEAARTRLLGALRGTVVTEEMVDRALFGAFPLIRGRDGNPDEEDRYLMRCALESVYTQLPVEKLVATEEMVERAVSYWRSHYVTSGWPGLSLHVAMQAVLDATLATPVAQVEG
jgi:hypothetical protein